MVRHWLLPIVYVISESPRIFLSPVRYPPSTAAFMVAWRFYCESMLFAIFDLYREFIIESISAFLLSAHFRRATWFLLWLDIFTLCAHIFYRYYMQLIKCKNNIENIIIVSRCILSIVLYRLSEKCRNALIFRKLSVSEKNDPYKSCKVLSLMCYLKPYNFFMEFLSEMFNFRNIKGFRHFLDTLCSQ